MRSLASALALAVTCAVAAAVPATPELPASFNLRFETRTSSGVNTGLSSMPAWAATTFTPDGQVSIDRRACGDEDCTFKVLWSSQVAVLPGGGFTEAGYLRFLPASGPGTPGDGVLRFASAAPGSSMTVPGTSGGSIGGITYNITGGEGCFEGATGWMMDTFVSDGTQAPFVIDAWGIVFLPKGEGEDGGETLRALLASTLDHNGNGKGKRNGQGSGIRGPWGRPGADSRSLAPWSGVQGFSIVFNNVPINGINHGVAPGSTVIDSKDEYVTNWLPTLLFTTSGGQTVNWTSHATPFPNGTFVNTGKLTLVSPEGANLGEVKFANAGLGHSGPVSPDGWSFGGIAYTLSGGSGAWANVTSGVMVDMFAAKGDATSFAIMAQGWFVSGSP